MKKTGVLNRHLAGALAELGHTDQVVVCDSGLPIPYGCDGPKVVDLSLVAGEPRFTAVVDALLSELKIDGALAACEVSDGNLRVAEFLTGRFQDLELVAHEELKKRVERARLVVRTGEATPYANVILRCGVPF
ncbi:D-ribose pyranase [Streptomyces sp. NBC_01187]|uniref:D-ribose pyranase n=1 Tax=Streptomyces sp. NBC_01187 TaxID=2903766 RepID=UPI00386F45CC|nr:D-ribose pyranase [Streptomyces sp. NBC_01187]